MRGSSDLSVANATDVEITVKAYVTTATQDESPDLDIYLGANVSLDGGGATCKVK